MLTWHTPPWKMVMSPWPVPKAIGPPLSIPQNLLLPLGIKFIPEEEYDQDSEEEPELEQCQIERQVSEKNFSAYCFYWHDPLAQSNLEHGQEHSSSNIEHVNPPVDHVDSIDRQQGSMAPPIAFSSDQLLDPQMSLDPQFLVPIEDSMGSDPTKSTHLSSKYNDTSQRTIVILW